MREGLQFCCHRFISRTQWKTPLWKRRK